MKKKTHTPKNDSDVSFSRIKLSIIITLSVSECDAQSGVTLSRSSLLF